MKVKCEYCGNVLQDTQDRCPNCGAPNKNLRRSSPEQPATIEDLKQWYNDRGLPPYETTRFFIGIDYRKPRAFGIYRDQNTGNIVVYKNKANGQRAIRYEGTDEAYAVNELLQRLKQEILEQKQHSQNNSQNASPETPNSKRDKKGCFTGCLFQILIFFGLFVLGPILLVFGIGSVILMTEPQTGYYQYQGDYYYHSGTSYNDRSWFLYDEENQLWPDPIEEAETPDILLSRSKSKSSYLGEDWNADMGCADFSGTVYAADLDYGAYLNVGYYLCDNTVYYHQIARHNEEWYEYSQNWRRAEFESLPYNLRHPSIASKLFLTDKSEDLPRPVQDFTDTLYYRDYHASKQIEKGYYRYDDAIFYHLASDYDEGWYTYSDNEWQTALPEDLPETFAHPSVVEDYYYTPNWNRDTQFTDFEDTPLYRSDKDNWSSSSSSNSSYDWGSSDSWDSGGSDWDSDW